MYFDLNKRKHQFCQELPAIHNSYKKKQTNTCYLDKFDKLNCYLKANSSALYLFFITSTNIIFIYIYSKLWILISANMKYVTSLQEINLAIFDCW